MNKSLLPFILFILFIPVSSLFAQWESVFFNDAGGIYSASSELEKPSDFMEIGRYSPMNLFDNDLSSSWVEGEDGPGIGSYVLVGIPGQFMKYLIIYNGYQESESLFFKNNRVKDLRVSIYTGFTFDGREGQTGFEADIMPMDESAIITLSDKMGAQQIELPFNADDVATFSEEGFKYYKYDFPEERGIRDFLVLKFEIESVYPGSIWDDTCIAGIDFTNQEPDQFLAPDEQVTAVSLEADSEKIIIQTTKNRKLVLVDAQSIAREKGYTAEGEFLTFTLMDVSPDIKWAVISYQHGFTSGGNIEESFHLWSLPRMKEVSDALLEAYGATPLGFKIKSGRLYLETLEDKSVLLEDLDLDMDSGYW